MRAAPRFAALPAARAWRSLRCAALAVLMATLILEVGMASTQAPGRTPARVCRWYDGKPAALSLRFDDSHPTHIEVAVPLLNEHDLIGTFLVNPGNDSFKKYQSVWEGEVFQRGHELADHTWNHRGAKTDAEADQQIGETADLLRRLQPGHQLVSFEPGGATLWMQRKPLEFYHAKYHLVDFNDTAPATRNVLSCAETHPWFNVARFTRHLDEAIASGGWFQPYFHQINETGHLRITPAHFREVLDVASAHRADLWQAGMTAIYEYQQERENAAVWPQAEGDDTLILDLTCGTDPNLYTQPLTLEVDLPAGMGSATVTDAAGAELACRVEQTGGRPVVRFDVPPADARFTIKAAGLGAAARPLIPEVHAPGAHPFVLFSAADIPVLTARNSDPLSKQMWDSIIRRADSLVDRDPVTEERSDQPWPRMGQELSPIDALAFAYALTHNRAYAAAAAARLETLADEDWWYGKKAEMLNTSAAVNTMGLAYDWLYDALTDAQRAKVRAAIVEHGIKAVLTAAEKGDWWTKWYHCNWGAVIFSEVGVAGLALLDEDPSASDLVRLCERKIWHYTHSLDPDGSWGEGVTYGAYAWANAITCADALRRVTGENLFDNPRLAKLPMWFIALMDPSGANFVPFSNCWNGSVSSPAGVLFRLAREYRDGHAQFVARRVIGRRGGDTLAFLSYDPTVEPKPLSDLPVDTVFRDLNWGFLRSSREDPNGTLFGFKGGHKEWDHSQHDTNSFVLYAYGKPLLIDLFYPHNIWGVKTEAHNTVMVDGEEQAGHVNVAGGRDDPNHIGIVAGLVDAPWYARVVGDASLAYEKDNLSSFVREVMYLRHASADAPPDYFVMLDDIESPAPSRTDWLLHTYGDASFSGNTLTVTQNEAAVDLTLVSPEKLTHEVSEKNLRDIQVPTPFEGASTVKTIKLHTPDPASRAFYLSVLVPRPSSDPAPATVTPVRQPNVLGAEVTSGATKDLALFALDAPEMSANGVEAVGRTCFVRTSGGRVRGAVIHNGQRLSAGGMLLFETTSAGQAVVTFGDDGVEAKLDMYDSDQVRLHVDRAPAKVVIDGKERAFEYDQATKCVTLKYYGIHEVDIRY